MPNPGHLAQKQESNAARVLVAVAAAEVNATHPSTLITLN